MTDRFSRARTRLLTHEQALVTKKSQAKRLGQKLPEEIVKIPKIGEWSLNSGTNNETNIENINNIPKKTEKDNKLLAPYHIRPPKAISDGNNHPVLQKNLNTHPGMTTDLNIIMKSKIKSPLRPLPPMKETLTSNEDSFLPLELFDDSSYSEYTIEELLQNPDALSKFQDKKGETKWESCKVLGYEPKDDLFTIEWNKSKKIKKVARFNLRFLIESEELFAKRLQAARESCRKFEMLFRFDNRVQQMPTDYLPELSPYDLENIWIRTGIANDSTFSDISNLLFEDTKNSFKTMNNMLEYIYELEHNPLLPNRDEFLSLFSSKKERTDYGLVSKSNMNFQSIFLQFQNKFLKSNPHVLSGLLTISDTFQSSLSVTFLKNGFEDTISLEEFVKRQTNELNQAAKLFKSSIQETLENVISTTMNDDYQYDRVKEKSLYQKMVSLTQRMLHTVLLDIIKNTLSDFFSLFAKYLNHENNNLLLCQFKVDLVLSEKFNLELSPSINTFRDSIISLLSLLERTVINLPEINLPILDVDMTTVSFADCLSSIINSKSELKTILNELFETLNHFIEGYREIESVLCLDPKEFVKQFDPDGLKTLNDYRSQLTEFQRVLDICQNQISLKYKLGIFQIN